MSGLGLKTPLLSTDSSESTGSNPLTELEERKSSSQEIIFLTPAAAAETPSLEDILAKLPEGSLLPFEVWISESGWGIPKNPSYHSKINAINRTLSLTDIKRYYETTPGMSTKRHMFGLEENLSLEDIHPAPIEFFKTIQSKLTEAEFRVLLSQHFGWAAATNTAKNIDQILEEYHSDLRARVETQEASTDQENIQNNSGNHSRLSKLTCLSLVSASLNLISSLIYILLSPASLIQLESQEIYKLIRSTNKTILFTNGSWSIYSLCSSLFENAEPNQNLGNLLSNGSFLISPSSYLIKEVTQITGENNASYSVYDFSINPIGLTTPLILASVSSLSAIGILFFISKSGSQLRSACAGIFANLYSLGLLALGCVFTNTNSLSQSLISGVSSIVACNSKYTNPQNETSIYGLSTSTYSTLEKSLGTFWAMSIAFTVITLSVNLVSSLRTRSQTQAPAPNFTLVPTIGFQQPIGIPAAEPSV